MLTRRRVGGAVLALAVLAGAFYAGNWTSDKQEARVLPGKFTPTPAPATGADASQILCSPAKQGTFDPIVAPGQDPFGHGHQFFGVKNITASSTHADLVGQPTSCAPDEPQDSAAYWVPILYVGDKQQPIQGNKGIRAYYTRPDNNRSGTAKKTFPITQAFPPDFRMIAGDSAALVPNENRMVAADRLEFFCYPVKRTKDSSEGPIPNCKSIGGSRMDVYITFPSCWVGTAKRAGDTVNSKGEVIDSPDHKSHVAWPATGTGVCPASHPKRLPQLTIQVIYEPWDAGEYFSSGPWWSVHADFLNSWVQPRFEMIVAGL